MTDKGEKEVEFGYGTVFFNQNPALVGLFDQKSKDAFASLRLSYGARGFPGAYRPNLWNDNIRTAYSGDRQLWVRKPFYWRLRREGLAIQPGATIGEYNAYLLYNAGEAKGHNQARDWYNLLRRPLNVTQGG